MTPINIALQSKVYQLLTSNSSLMGKITGVFDCVPDNQPFPYITIGEDNYKDFDTHTSNGIDGYFQIDVWTSKNNSTGRKTCKEIQDQVYMILNDIDLQIDNFSTILCKCTLTTSNYDPDGRTVHGVQRFSVILSDP